MAPYHTLSPPDGSVVCLSLCWPCNASALALLLVLPWHSLGLLPSFFVSRRFCAGSYRPGHVLDHDQTRNRSHFAAGSGLPRKEGCIQLGHLGLRRWFLPLVVRRERILLFAGRQSHRYAHGRTQSSNLWQRRLCDLSRRYVVPVGCRGTGQETLYVLLGLAATLC